MTLKDVLKEADPAQGRAFAVGVLVSFIDLLSALDAYGKKYKSFDDLIRTFPLQSQTAAKKRANTLIVQHGKATLSIRPFYNAFERFMRADNKRFDYPSCAPHATQAWSDYVHWFQPLLACTRSQSAKFRKEVVDFALAKFPSQKRKTEGYPKEPPLFAILLEEFDFATRKGEPPGAAFQGAVFAFVRADNPHLQVEIDKVKTGSKRLNRIGDVDAWDGDRLITSVEVKHFLFKEDDVKDIARFVDDITAENALGIVVALDFEEAARDRLEESGIRARSLEDLVQAVSLWDPLKQKTAINAFLYYVVHREQKAALITRVRQFLGEAMRAARKAAN